MGKLIGVLLIIAAVCGLALALIYGQTSLIIEKQKQLALNESCKAVLPADNYRQMPENGSFYEALNSESKIVGWCLKTQTKGYGGTIQLLVGVDQGKSITGIKVLEHNETPGLGSRMTEDSFLGQFKAKKLNNLELTKIKSEDKIQAIAGATISSRAVTEGVFRDIEALLKIIEKK
ncbi:MAG: RnfABCDGE type electron transport complex subunit G [Candidatus Omnitrophica bacterium]|nr:RnfABCDGE type electron transport complex subunit G [Candidatus Omnitrophota bacterium]